MASAEKSDLVRYLESIGASDDGALARRPTS